MERNTTPAPPLNHTDSSHFVPFSDEFFQNLTVAETIFVVVCALVTIATLAIFVEEVVYVTRHYKTSNDIKIKTLQVLSILPVISLVAFLALCIPRANTPCHLIIFTYISVTLYNFVNLMILYCGGLKQMLPVLKDATIELQSPPFCCCCPCLPSKHVTQQNVQRLIILVLQSALSQPIFAALSLFLWIDTKYTKGKISLTDSYPYITFFSQVSFLLSLYGFIMFFGVCKVYLKPVFILVKYLSVQLIVLVCLLQEAVFSILAKFGLPASRGILSSDVRGEAYFLMAVIIQVMLLSVLSRHVYRHPHDQIRKLNTDHDQNDGNNTNHDTIKCKILPGDETESTRALTSDLISDQDLNNPAIPV
ncbi:organic solute transporter subunit alpha-like [Physella acuta]|uniref:organic solute transporter subunit alpha-like n=1 Tax=Physella acuta TaxID=109671 RepID=UPI0027DD4282|nr:organic solute transporter subunit alpha-like [Physella acuta]XP_059178599.1 organic solute transporter subunit alpha-like [Physella acuta]XP_059178672.1 organic solute transporter subunit alpha-like [Physella acuta]XP_059178750.1 organic solute transporter subunit alpha-like [Physella acuta]